MLGKAKLIILFLSALIVSYGLVGGLLEKVSAGDDPYAPLAIFAEVLDKLKSDYVEEPEMNEALKGALHGMMEALDPYSSFVDSATYLRFSKQSPSEPSPGLILSKRYGYAYVVAVLPESPAEAEGLRSGDLLESIDGLATSKMSLWEEEARLRGPEGSRVNLRVIRARRSEPSGVELVRKKSVPAPVVSKIVDREIGMLKIPAFTEGVAEEVLGQLKRLSASDVEGWLIDIRGNAQGQVEEAVRVADYFLERGKKILTVKDRDDSSLEFLSLTEPLVSGRPVVLLFDGGTSGPAEVFAAALWEHGVATTVGERTNGRGSEQQPFVLADGSVLLITTRLYLRPQGSPIQAVALRESGLKPDLRSPDPDFVSSFYFENTSDELQENLTDEFYRRLDKAISEEQIRSALESLREKVLKKAA